MTLGTKTLLFGVHQIFIHPIMVTLAWIILYRSLPTWRELICIIIHDWGYWGKPSLKCQDGDRHPELGANIANYLFGQKYSDFILGHSSFYIKRNGIPRSKLLAPDKYWHCLIPLWFYKLLAVPTGEFAHYRGVKHARQVSKNIAEPDCIWWARLVIVCYEKTIDKYEIKTSKLDGGMPTNMPGIYTEGRDR